MDDVEGGDDDGGKSDENEAKGGESNETLYSLHDLRETHSLIHTRNSKGEILHHRLHGSSSSVGYESTMKREKGKEVRSAQARELNPKLKPSWNEQLSIIS